MKAVKLLTVIGTRPEAIKMVPILKKLDGDPRFSSILCATGQHREMTKGILKQFNIRPDYNLDSMKPDQGLTDILCAVAGGIERVIRESRPDMLLVQGDTTTTMAASLSGFYNKVAIGHVEAGLRTGNLYSPWPEEGNRKVCSSVASLHFAPTGTARDNLLHEGVSPELIHVTGNTVVDALQLILSGIKSDFRYQEDMRAKYPYLSECGAKSGKHLILVTGHRRESFGEGFVSICRAIRKIAARPDVVIVYPVHLNPNVRGPVTDMLGNVPNIKLLPPLEYQDFVHFMNNARLILTDSGGVQEEAPSLSKPVLVMREVTERSEAIDAGAVRLVGTAADLIHAETCRLLDDEHAYQMMCISENPYGDGKASERILDAIASRFNQNGAKF